MAQSNPQSYSEGRSIDELVGRLVNKHPKIGITTSDQLLREISGNELTRVGFAVTALNPENLIASSQDVYVIDLEGLADYSAINTAIKQLRESRPDSEIVLLSTDQVLSRPQALPLKRQIAKYLVVTYTRPSPSQGIDYGAALQSAASELNRAVILPFLTQPSLIKIGGSLFDLYDTNPQVIFKLLEKVKELHGEGYNIILTTGGGPRNDAERLVSGAYGVSIDPAAVLKRQAATIEQILGSAGEYVPPGRLRTELPFSYEWLRRKILITSLSSDSKIPPTESDAHTLRIAEAQGLYKVIFAKDTDGVYHMDPYKQPRRERGRWPWQARSNGKDNPFFPYIYASEVLNGRIDRTDAQGRGEHLIETSALFFLRSTNIVRSVQVVNGTKPEFLRYALSGQRYAPGTTNYVGSFILRG